MMDSPNLAGLAALDLSPGLWHDIQYQPMIDLRRRLLYRRRRHAEPDTREERKWATSAT